MTIIEKNMRILLVVAAVALMLPFRLKAQEKEAKPAEKPPEAAAQPTPKEEDRHLYGCTSGRFVQSA